MHLCTLYIFQPVIISSKDKLVNFNQDTIDGNKQIIRYDCVIGEIVELFVIEFKNNSIKIKFFFFLKKLISVDLAILEQVQFGNKKKYMKIIIAKEIYIPGDQEGLFKLAIQLRNFFIFIYNTVTGYVLLVYLTNI
jgi:hypothetical protein